MSYTVYLITDTATGTVYVGSTKHTLEWRLNAHMKFLLRNQHGTPRLQEAFNTHGAESFTIQVLEVASDKKSALECERAWTKAFPAVFNEVNTDRWGAKVKAAAAEPNAKAKRSSSQRAFRKQQFLDTTTPLQRSNYRYVLSLPWNMAYDTVGRLSAAYSLNRHRLTSFLHGKNLDWLDEDV